MKKRIGLLVVGAAMTLGAMAMPAVAKQPDNPGCFGRDRAAYIHTVFQTDDTAPGASEWGKIAGERAGDNGAINQAYRASDSCGQYSS